VNSKECCNEGDLADMKHVLHNFKCQEIPDTYMIHTFLVIMLRLL